MESDVAKHLSDNYGDRAWAVCELAQPTGKAWPLHGLRLAGDYPCTHLLTLLLLTFILTPPSLVIDAEVRYAVLNEYAQTAVDVIARRTRLSFLNAQAALDALPQVVDIMASELHWDNARKEAEIDSAIAFLGTMGLAPGLAPRSLAAREESRSVLAKAKGLVGLSPNSTASESRRQPEEMFYSRAQFDAGEVEELRSAFSGRAKPKYEPSMTPRGVVSPVRVSQPEIYDIVQGLPGFEGIKKKDYEYVLEEAGYARQGDLDFDEFVDVSRFSSRSRCVS